VTMAAVVASKVKRQRSSRGAPGVPGGIQLEIGPDGRVRPVADASAPRDKEAEAKARRARKAAAAAAAASAEYYRKVKHLS
jgi:hypothetical protein